MKLADTQDLGSCAFGRVGSSPTFRTESDARVVLDEHWHEVPDGIAVEGGVGLAHHIDDSVLRNVRESHGETIGYLLDRPFLVGSVHAPSIAGTDGLGKTPIRPRLPRRKPLPDRAAENYRRRIATRVTSTALTRGSRR